MAEKREQRRKNIGFKAKGVDPIHDMVYAVLASLPRGAISKFVVMAVKEYLENHSGETITGSKQKKYIILKSDGIPGASSGQSPATKKPVSHIEEEIPGSGQERMGSTPKSTPTEIPHLKATLSSEGNVKREPASTESSEAEPLANPQKVPPYTELDDETLDNLVLGFNSQLGE